MGEEISPPEGAADNTGPGETEATNVNQATREGVARERGRERETNNTGTGRLKTTTENEHIQDHGDKLEEKSNNQMRIITIQMNGYPISPLGARGRTKMMVLEDLIKEAEPDIILTQEENRKWEIVERKETPKYKFDHMGIVTNHVTNEKGDQISGTHLQGGNAIWVIGKARGYIERNKHDKRRLGRWARTDIQGKNGKKPQYTQCTCPTIPQE